MNALPDPTDSEVLDFLQGKLAWLAYLEQWLADNTEAKSGNPNALVEAAWAQFRKDHPDIALGPGFVKP